MAGGLGVLPTRKLRRVNESVDGYETSEQEGDPKRTTAFEARSSRPCLRIARAVLKAWGNGFGRAIDVAKKEAVARGATAISHSMSASYAASGIVLSLTRIVCRIEAAVRWIRSSDAVSALLSPRYSWM